MVLRSIIILLLSLCTLYSAKASTVQAEEAPSYDYQLADSIAESLSGYGLKNIPLLAKDLTDQLTTEHEKFRVIFYWVATNIENDYIYFLKNQRKRKRFADDPVALASWNAEFAPKIYERLLKQQKTVCTGYAVLIEELCYYAGIEAEIVHGYGKVSQWVEVNEGQTNHSWNAVKLEGKWYLADATWAAGIIYTDRRGFQFDYTDAYFLSAPQLFALNHYPQDPKWLLIEEELSFETFQSRSVASRYTLEMGLLPQEKARSYQQNLSKGEQLVLTYEMKEELPELHKKLLVLNIANQMVSLQDLRIEGNKLMLELIANRKGKNEGRFFYGTKPLFTYSFKVN